MEGVYRPESRGEMEIFQKEPPLPVEALVSDGFPGNLLNLQLQGHPCASHAAHTRPREGLPDPH